jgi:hypothetical protein
MLAVVLMLPSIIAQPTGENRYGFNSEAIHTAAHT